MQRRAKQSQGWKVKKRHGKDHQVDETERIKAVMMCWENSDGSLVKEPDKKTDNQERRANEEMQNQKMRKNMSILHYIQATD